MSTYVLKSGEKVQLTVRDVAKLLNISEKTVYRWVKSGKLPAYRVQDQYRFNRPELLEWATSRRVGLSPEVLREPREPADDADEDADRGRLSAAIERGGIFYRIAGAGVNDVLAALVDLIALPPELDRDALLSALIAREELASTGIGDGVAIPHVRGPVVVQVEQPFLTLGFLEEPIDFNSIDGLPVHAFFFLICPTIRTHLRMLSRLSLALRDPSFKEVVRRQALREDVLRELLRIDDSIDGVGRA